MQALLIPVGHDMYALDAATVREVVNEPLPTRLPTAPPAVCGLFNLRGEVVPLFDTAALLGVGRIGTWMFAVVVTTAAGSAGLVVTGLPKVVQLEDHVGPSELGSTIGVFMYAGGVAVLLDVDALLLGHSAVAGAANDHGSGR